MKELRIIAKTEKGEKALKQHVAECCKLKRAEKMMRKLTGVNQEVSCLEPYTIRLWATPNKPFSLVKPKHAITEINEQLAKNGAVPDIDFKVESD